MSSAPEPVEWPVETIDDDDWLYRRFPLHYLKPDGTISSKAFMRNSERSPRLKEPDPDVSVDWDRYATPQQVLALAERPTHGIGALQPGLPRSLGLTVVHSPDRARHNRAHSSILGNEGPDAKRRCAVLAEAISKRILIWPTSAA